MGASPGIRISTPRYSKKEARQAAAKEDQADIIQFSKLLKPSLAFCCVKSTIARWPVKDDNERQGKCIRDDAQVKCPAPAQTSNKRVCYYYRSALCVTDDQGKDSIARTDDRTESRPRYCGNIEKSDRSATPCSRHNFARSCKRQLLDSGSDALYKIISLCGGILGRRHLTINVDPAITVSTTDAREATVHPKKNCQLRTIVWGGMLRSPLVNFLCRHTDYP